MHIGLIGGIGVAATLAYYKRLAAAVDASGGVLECMIVHANVHDLARNNRSDNREEQARIYVGLIDRLAAAGADCAAITSMGGHFCFAEAQAMSALPLVSGIAPLDAYFASEGLSRVGILGTWVVQRTGFYGSLSLTEPVILHDEVEQIGQTYQDIAVPGRCTPEQRAYFLAAGQRLIERGAEAVVLGGTDLGLAFDGQATDYRVIDALDVHVGVLARLALGQDRLDSVEQET